MRPYTWDLGTSHMQSLLPLLVHVNEPYVSSSDLTLDGNLNAGRMSYLVRAQSCRVYINIGYTYKATMLTWKISNLYI